MTNVKSFHFQTTQHAQNYEMVILLLIHPKYTQCNTGNSLNIHHILDIILNIIHPPSWHATKVRSSHSVSIHHTHVWGTILNFHTHLPSIYYTKTPLLSPYRAAFEGCQAWYVKEGGVPGPSTDVFDGRKAGWGYQALFWNEISS